MITTFTKLSTRVTMVDTGTFGLSVNPAAYNVEKFGTTDIIIRTNTDKNVDPIWQGKYDTMTLASQGDVPTSQDDAFAKLNTYFFI